MCNCHSTLSNFLRTEVMRWRRSWINLIIPTSIIAKKNSKGQNFYWDRIKYDCCCHWQLAKLTKRLVDTSADLVDSLTVRSGLFDFEFARWRMFLHGLTSPKMKSICHQHFSWHSSCLPANPLLGLACPWYSLLLSPYIHLQWMMAVVKDTSIYFISVLLAIDLLERCARFWIQIEETQNEFLFVL